MLSKKRPIASEFSVEMGQHRRVKQHWMEDMNHATNSEPMNLVPATIKPFKLDRVLEALRHLDVHAVTVMETNRYGAQKGRTQIYRAAKYASNFIPMVEIEFMVSGDQIKRVTEVITDAARTGEVDDGEILSWVWNRGAVGIAGTGGMVPHRAA
jgi:nitrogen regulatory protein P-II 2